MVCSAAVGCAAPGRKSQRICSSSTGGHQRASVSAFELREACPSPRLGSSFRFPLTSRAMSRLQPSQTQDSLRTRRLSTGERPAGNSGPAPPVANSGSSRSQLASSGESSSRPPKQNSGPPPSRSAGAATARPGAREANNTPQARPQSNVGAKLLKKRQSVSYQQAVADGLPVRQQGAIPAMPSLPTGMAGVGVAGASGVGAGGGLGGGAGSGLKLGAHLTPRGEGENQLVATGLDVDQLASEAFKPEDCESPQVARYGFVSTVC